MSYEIGDHLTTPLLGVFTHHGIYVGEGFVIEKTRDGVQHSNLEEFSEGSEISVVDHSVRLYSREESVARAFSRLGDTEYNVIFDNCEEFVYWCIDGIPYSEQVAGVVTGTLHAYKKMDSLYTLMQQKVLPETLIKYLKSSPEFVKIMYPSIVPTASSTIMRTFLMKIGLIESKVIVGAGAAEALFSMAGASAATASSVASLAGIAASVGATITEAVGGVSGVAATSVAATGAAVTSGAAATGSVAASGIVAGATTAAAATTAATAAAGISGGTVAGVVAGGATAAAGAAAVAGGATATIAGVAATGVAATVAAPVVLVGAAAAGVGYGVKKLWDAVTDWW